MRSQTTVKSDGSTHVWYNQQKCLLCYDLLSLLSLGNTVAAVMRIHLDLIILLQKEAMQVSSGVRVGVVPSKINATQGKS